MAGNADLVFEKGATFSAIVTWRDRNTRVPIDLTGYAARMQVRISKDAPGTLLDLTSAPNGGLVIAPALGQVHITVGAAATAAFTWARAYYDLLLFIPGDPSEARRLIEGHVRVSTAVTHGP